MPRIPPVASLALHVRSRSCRGRYTTKTFANFSVGSAERPGFRVISTVPFVRAATTTTVVGGILPLPLPGTDHHHLRSSRLIGRRQSSNDANTSRSVEGEKEGATSSYVDEIRALHDDDDDDDHDDVSVAWRARSLLERAFEAASSDEGPPPDAASVDRVLRLWIRRRRRDPSFATRAQETHDRAPSDHAARFSLLVEAWSLSREAGAASRAASLIEGRVRDRAATPPTPRDLALTLGALSRGGGLASARRARRALGATDDRARRERANENDEATDERPRTALPDAEQYEHVLRAYANVDPSAAAVVATEVEALLDRMDERAVSRTAAGLAAAIGVVGPDRAEALLEEAERTDAARAENDDDEAAPFLTVDLYRRVLTALVGADRATDRAERVLRRALDRCSSSAPADEDALRATAVRACVGNVRRAAAIAREGESASVREALLAVCAASADDDPTAALAVAAETLRSLRTEGAATSERYALALECCAKQRTVGARRRAVRAVHRRCREDGSLDDRVRAIAAPWLNRRDRERDDDDRDGAAAARREEERERERRRMKGLREKRGQKLLRGGRS